MKETKETICVTRGRIIAALITATYAGVLLDQHELGWALIVAFIARAIISL